MTLKEVKVNFIVDTAKELFFKDSIFNVTIKDIADKAGVGEMTVYRYFKKKQNIVLAVALKLQQEITSYFDLSKGNTGFEKLSIFYNSFLTIFKESIKHYQFIRDFDSYMLEFKDDANLGNYEASLDDFKHVFFDAYDLGLKDGSVKNIEHSVMFYYSSTHSLLELCKKLSSVGLLRQDELLEKHQEIQTLIDVFLSYLKNS